MTKASSNFTIGVASAALLTAFCQISLMPLLMSGVPVNDNFLFNAPWIMEFSDQVRNGDLYPRWLTNYSNDLGAPIFYYYAPGPFYLETLFQFICSSCDLRWSMTLTQFSFYFLSAAAFFLWARSFAGWRSSFFGALLYMSAPYHLVDIEQRGSLGEAMNFVMAPLALLSLSKTMPRSQFPILGTLSFAVMIFCHLPTALLFVPILVTFGLANSKTGARINLVGRLSQIGIGGALLAAAYLLPAIQLQEHLIKDGWIVASGVSYRPVDWLLFREGALDQAGVIVRNSVVAILALSTNAALLAFVALLAIRIVFSIQGDFFAPPALPYFRGSIAILIVSWLLMTELFFWLYAYVGPFKQIQFPWRIGIFLELSVATIVALSIDRLGQMIARHPSTSVRLGSTAIAVVAALLVASVISVAAGLVIKVGRTVEPELALTRQGSGAFDFGMPKGHRLFAEYPVEYRSKWMVNSIAYVSAPPVPGLPVHDSAYLYWKEQVLAERPVEVESSSSLRGLPKFVQSGPTRFSLQVALVEPATIKVRRLYFPSWRIRDENTGNALALWPSEEDGLIEFELPAGYHSLRLETFPLRAEIVGATISLLAGLGLLTIWIRQRRLII